MEMYQDGHLDLENCGPVVQLIKIVDAAVDAMNSRIPATALTLDSPGQQVNNFQAISFILLIYVFLIIPINII